MLAPASKLAPASNTFPPTSLSRHLSTVLLFDKSRARRTILEQVRAIFELQTANVQGVDGVLASFKESAAALQHAWNEVHLDSCSTHGDDAKDLAVFYLESIYAQACIHLSVPPANEHTSRKNVIEMILFLQTDLPAVLDANGLSLGPLLSKLFGHESIVMQSLVSTYTQFLRHSISALVTNLCHREIAFFVDKGHIHIRQQEEASVWDDSRGGTVGVERGRHCIGKEAMGCEEEGRGLVEEENGRVRSYLAEDLFSLLHRHIEESGQSQSALLQSRAFTACLETCQEVLEKENLFSLISDARRRDLCASRKCKAGIFRLADTLCASFFASLTSHSNNGGISLSAVCALLNNAGDCCRLCDQLQDTCDQIQHPLHLRLDAQNALSKLHEHFLIR